jgi:hypothetical protein
MIRRKGANRTSVRLALQCAESDQHFIGEMSDADRIQAITIAQPVRTVLGDKWDHTSQGDRPCYLSEADLLPFQMHVIKCGRAINCLTKSEAIGLAFHLRQPRLQSDDQLLHILKSDGLNTRLVQMYGPQEPEGDTIRTICHLPDLYICNSQNSELARRLFCNRDGIAAFFDDRGHCRCSAS